MPANLKLTPKQRAQNGLKWLWLKLDWLLEWLGFCSGLVLGIFLAYVVYAGLKPRIVAAVHNAAIEAAQPTPGTPNHGTGGGSTGGGSTGGGSTSNTVLKANTSSPDESSHKMWSEWAAALAMAAGLVAGVWAWRQSRQQPQPTGNITSPVLETLFTLDAHKTLLKENLRLSPRQIKRFSNKARVQHSQLRVLARPDGTRPEISFSVDNQIKAFQMLLLLEGDREKPQQFSPDDPEKFIVELQLACTQDKQLAQAREQAEATGVIMAAKAQERAKAATPPTHAAEREFMLQLYELNAGLLA